MQLRKLGSRGPEISVVGYGAWEIGGEAYGPNAGDDEVIKAIHAGLDAGINWIDTAEVYGRGNSERIVGIAIKDRRDKVLVATKVAPAPVGTGYRPQEVKRAAKQSLQRLGIDHIDLYQLHWKPESDWDIEDTWGAMVELQADGIARWIGVSNFTREQIQRCLAVGHCDSLQPQFSLLHRQEEELIAWCGTVGVGVIVYGPLAYGLLTGKIDESTRFDPEDWRSGRNPEHPYYAELFAPGRIEHSLEVARGLTKVAEHVGVSAGQLALAWCFHRDGVTAAISGSRNSKHNKENASAGDIKLTHAQVREITALVS